MMKLRMKIPEELINRLQYSFVGEKYKSGVFVVSTLKEPDIISMLGSFFIWCDENGLVKGDNCLDISMFLEKEDMNGEEKDKKEKINE